MIEQTLKRLALPLLLLLALSTVVQAQFVCITNNDTITITGYSGPGGAVTIPSTINGWPVTGIGDSAFESSFGLTSVTVPETITNIGVFSFSYCANLTAITVATNNPAYSSVNGVLFDKGQTTLIACPGRTTGGYTVSQTVTNIEDGAFAGGSLMSITIPESVTTIGNSAFSGCDSLMAITVATNNPAYSSADGIFFNKSKTRLILCPRAIAGTYIIPDSVTRIGESAFWGCSRLKSITIPGSVTDIEDTAFYSCYILTGATIPDSVTTIGTEAFDNCFSLTNITIGSGVTNIGLGAFSWCIGATAITVATNNPAYISLDGVLFDESQTTLIQCPGAITEPYTIPESVTTIGFSAFGGCKLTNVMIPLSVTNIGDGAFDQSALTSVNIPNSVTTIGSFAFFYCYNLTSVTLSTNVTSIGDRAFYGCSHLTGIYFPGNRPPTFGPFLPPPFQGVNQATFYYLPGPTNWSATFEGIPTAPWLPQVPTTRGSFGIRTNQFSFNINWASGQTVVVEACTNLANPDWSAVGTNTLTDGSSYFSDPQWTNYPGRFYRLRSP